MLSPLTIFQIGIKFKFHNSYEGGLAGFLRKKEEPEDYLKKEIMETASHIGKLQSLYESREIGHEDYEEQRKVYSEKLLKEITIEEAWSKMVKFIKKDKEFAEKIGSGIGVSLDMMPPEITNKALSLTDRKAFIKSLGEGVGRIFGRLSVELQDRVLQVTKLDENFTYGFANGVGLNFNGLSCEIQDKILSFEEDNNLFGTVLGLALSKTFDKLSEDLQDKLLSFGSKNFGFANFFNANVGNFFDKLPSAMQDKISKNRLN